MAIFIDLFFKFFKQIRYICRSFGFVLLFMPITLSHSAYFMKIFLVSHVYPTTDFVSVVCVIRYLSGLHMLKSVKEVRQKK